LRTNGNMEMKKYFVINMQGWDDITLVTAIQALGFLYTVFQKECYHFKFL
jgi:hypothetical protein